MFSCKALSYNDLSFFPEDKHASNNITDSGRRKYDYTMSCYYIPVNCISANLINKTETNKTHFIKTIIIDTN